MKKLALLAVFLALPIFGQTAKVIALSPSDAAEAKSLYAQREALDKKIAELREKITRTYLTAASDDMGRRQMAARVDGSSFILKSGWGSDFLYSEDFRFIVPPTVTTWCTTGGLCSGATISANCGNVNTPYWLNGGNLIATPALGNTFLAN